MVCKEVRMKRAGVKTIEWITQMSFLSTCSQVFPVHLYEWTMATFRFLCRKRWGIITWKSLNLGEQLLWRSWGAKLNEPCVHRACCSVTCILLRKEGTVGSHWAVRTPWGGVSGLSFSMKAVRLYFDSEIPSSSFSFFPFQTSSRAF